MAPPSVCAAFKCYSTIQLFTDGPRNNILTILLKLYPAHCILQCTRLPTIRFIFAVSIFLAGWGWDRGAGKKKKLDVIGPCETVGICVSKIERCFGKRHFRIL